MDLVHWIIVSLSFVALTVGFPRPPAVSNCGYQSCHPNKEGLINVHMVPHTHDDVGWLKTVDQYYYGAGKQYQNAGVQYILDTVVDSLQKNPDRRFIYVETAFFWKWWIKQDDTVKSIVQDLVANGQLEFISGGWSMNDEASTHYHSIIDQMAWGLRKLNDTFGECGVPKMGWQIDPFGHSKEMANIFAQLGFDGLLLGRIDYQEKQFRWQTRTPEMVWRGSESLGESSDIFTGVMYNTYGEPPGFCFDLLCGDEPIIDDPDSFEYNVDRRVDDFIKYLDDASKVYSTNNLIITMGGDFNYQDADPWYINMDKLIYYANERQTNGSKYNLIYSTPSCYVKAIHDETENRTDWLLKQDDFFPYASDPHAFWTGYFTSRPALKRYERLGNNFLQICKQLYGLADLGPEHEVDLDPLRESMGVLQHHDAVSGTEKQHVANDYARHLQKSIEKCEKITTAAISKLSNQTEEDIDLLPLNTCLLNISQCADTETNKQFIVTIYNPLSRPVNKIIRFPVLGTFYTVTDGDGNNLTNYNIPIPDFVLNIPGRASTAENDLAFIARDIPPLGWKSFVVSEDPNGHNGPVVPEKNLTNKLEGTAFGINVDSGLVDLIWINNVSVPVTQNFYYYNGFVGDNGNSESRSSGAYIFRPNAPLQNITDIVDYKIVNGGFMIEIHQTFNEYIGQIVRMNTLDNFIEFDWVVGPLPQDGPNGFEIVTKYTSNITSNSTFFTDSNGKEMLKRIRDFRPTWELDSVEPVSGNYYPVTSQISIRDEELDVELAVLVDRAQGGSSLQDGEIEVMVHRNCLHDDAFGVGEALNETAFDRGLVIRGSHYVTVGAKNPIDGITIASITKDIAQRKLLDTWTFITPVTDVNKDHLTSNFGTFSGLRTALPNNVQILTFEPWIGTSFLLRLEHVFEKNEDSVLSEPVVVALPTLFTSFEIVSAEETTLGGNQWLKDNHRLHFNTSGSIEDLRYQNYHTVTEHEAEAQKLWKEKNIYAAATKKHADVIVDDDPLNVTLGPGQIRTFIVEIKRNSFVV